MRTADDSFNLAWHCLGRQAEERGDKTALILCDGPDAFRSWTYADLDQMVRRLAGGWIASGLVKGDRMMIRAANDIEFVLAFFATTAIGCVAQPASPLLTAEEALALAADSGAAAVFLGDANAGERRLFSNLRVIRPAGYTPPRRRGRARRLRADRARRSRLSCFHLRLHSRAERRPARPEGRDRPAADGARLAGANSGRRRAARRQHQLDLCARRRRARSFRLRRDRGALCGTARFIGLAQAHQTAPGDDLRRRAEPLSPDSQIRRSAEIRSVEPASWRMRRRGALSRPARPMARGDRNLALRSLRHERDLDLHLVPSGRADPARLARTAADGAAHRRSADRRGNRATAARARRLAGRPPQRSGPDARLLEPAGRRGRSLSRRLVHRRRSGGVR